MNDDDISTARDLDKEALERREAADRRKTEEQLRTMDRSLLKPAIPRQAQTALPERDRIRLKIKGSPH